jgi:hypothetical protein
MTKPYIRVRCVLAGQVSAIQMETRWVGVSDEVGRAMSVVYKARDPKVDRFVAVKTISLSGRFRELGFIHYNSGLQVHSSLLNIVLHN